MDNLIFIVNPSKIFDILEGKEKVEKKTAKEVPRYFLEIDNSIRKATHFQQWVAEKKLEIAIQFKYLVDDKEYSIFLILRGRPDFYDPRQGIVLEQKKQFFPFSEFFPDEKIDRFNEDLNKAWTQVALYAFMLYTLGFKVQAVGVQFLWPGKTESSQVVIGGWEIPVPESTEQKSFCDVVPFTEDDVAEVKNMLWNLGLTLLLKHIKQSIKQNKE
jgi:hypothetical protein